MYIYKIGLATLTLVLFGAGCTSYESEKQTSDTAETTPIQEEQSQQEDTRSFDTRIIFTADPAYPDATGEGYYGVIDGETRVFARTDVPEPEEGFFYEGWLVCDKNPISTGELRLMNGMYENYFASSDIPKTCQKYVLTIEPDDNDPAPADHVLDGVFEDVSEDEQLPYTWDDEYFQTFSS